MNGPNVNVEVAAIKEASKHRDREIRDLKGAMKEVNDKLDSVITQLTRMHDLPEDMSSVKREVKSLTKDRDEMTGSIRLGKWIVGTGLFGFVGSSAYGLWHILTGK